jgi:hypothetical protein
MPHPPTHWRETFLAALAEYPIVSHAARLAGVGYRNAYLHREKDEEFAKAWDDALEQGVDRAEQEAFRRAVVGYERYVATHTHAETGEQVEEEKWRMVLDAHGQPIPLTTPKQSDALLSLVLKGRRKKVYADRTELTGAEGAPMQIDETARSARVAQLLAMAERRKAEQDEFGDLA